MGGDPLDLDAIEARAKDASAAIFAGDWFVVQRGAAARLAREDVPALVAEVRRLRAHVGGLSEDKQRLRRECGCLASDALSDCCDVNVSPYWERRFVSPWERVK